MLTHGLDLTAVGLNVTVPRDEQGSPFRAAGRAGRRVLLALGGVSVLLGICPDLGALLLVVFLVPTALLMHPFWKEAEAQAKMTEQVQFFKDTALAGAALMLFALFAYVGDDLGLVIVGPLFSL